MLTAFFKSILNLVATKFVREFYARACALASKWIASAVYNKDEKKQSDNLDKSKDELKKDLEKAGDDVKSQENAADDFFNKRR